MTHTRYVLAAATALAALGAHSAAGHFAFPPLAAQTTTGPRDAMLTSVSWLAGHIHDPHLVVLEASRQYAQGHIPGSRDLVGAVNLAGPDSVSSDDKFRAVLESLGVSDASRIVIAADDPVAPSSIYLLIDHLGLSAHTSVLEGGVREWKASGQATTADIPSPVRGSLTARATTPLVVDADYVQAHLHTPGFAVVDVRLQAAWAGIQPVDPNETPQRFGHIPGAKSLPFELLWDSQTGHLRPAAELQQLFHDAGARSGDTIIGYCYVGKRANATLFAARTLGYTVRLYQGSMGDWATRHLPLEMPDKRGTR